MKEILDYIDSVDQLDLDGSFRLADKCSRLLRKRDTEVEGRKLIIHILDNWEKICKPTRDIWSSLIESVGFYPYIGRENEIKLDDTASKIRREFHKSDYLDGKYLHEEQKEILSILNRGKNLIVSAPTSFGKSLLIEEIIASRVYKNIVIIQPTLALLDETRRKLQKYELFYKLIVRTTQKPSEKKGNIFLLTAERVMEYGDFPKIEFLILDEFYKVSAKRDDERSDILNNALNLLVNRHGCRFYLLGPNIDGISEGFAEQYNAVFYRTDYSLVDTNIIDYYSKYRDSYGKRGKGKEFKEQKLFELLYQLKNEQTIIYCSSPNRVRYLSIKFKEYLKSRSERYFDSDIPLIEWIENYIDRNWSIIECLKYGVGIHDGALPKHMTTSIIKYFNNNKIKYLFCTSTIIEGVNTSSKNVIYFDSTKGFNTKIDYFDYSNIKGRAGRMMVHYIGNVYNFNPQPVEENIIIDIPFFDQNPISDEVLINLEDKDIRDRGSDQYNRLKSIPEELKIIIRRNGVSIEGQKRIIKILEKDIIDKYDLICWNRFPSYNQLKYILSLGGNNLLKQSEITRSMTINKLVKLTFDYGQDQNILRLVQENIGYMKSLNQNRNKGDQELLDNAIKESFQILKHWFQYKVPKLLRVINDLQQYVCEKQGLTPGDYLFYANNIENEFISDNLAILYEYGVPQSAIKKISKNIPSSIEEEEVIPYIKSQNLIENSGLILYEKEKIYENI